jgi:hypothetical protein
MDISSFYEILDSRNIRNNADGAFSIFIVFPLLPRCQHFPASVPLPQDATDTRPHIPSAEPVLITAQKEFHRRKAGPFRMHYITGFNYSQIENSLFYTDIEKFPEQSDGRDSPRFTPHTY